MLVAIFLPGRGVAFVVVLNAPVFAGGLRGTGLFFLNQTGDEDTGVALEGLRVFFSNQSRCTVIAQ